MYSFKEFKTECKRLIYEADESTAAEKIKDVEKYEDLYISYYGEGMTPEEANKEHFSINVSDYYNLQFKT